MAATFAVIGFIAMFCLLAYATFAMVIVGMYGGLDLGPLKGWALVRWFMFGVGLGVLWYMLFSMSPLQISVTIASVGAYQ